MRRKEERETERMRNEERKCGLRGLIKRDDMTREEAPIERASSCGAKAEGTDGENR